MKKIDLHQKMWLAPFFVFFSTYLILHLWFKSDAFQIPELSGLHLVEATKLLSKHRLHPEIIQTKQDGDLPDATVVHQTPPAGRMVKPNQTIYIAITEKPTPKIAPSCIGLTQQEITLMAQALGIKPTFYEMPYGSYPKGKCFAQWPSADQTLKNRLLICYIAQDEQQLILMPDFNKKTLQEVQQFVSLYNIKLHTDINIQPGKNYRIDNQQPKAGAFLDLKEAKNITVYVTLSSLR